MKVAVTVLVGCVAALLALGMVMLYSSSMAQVGARYLLTQLIWCALGLVLGLTAATLDYRRLKKFALPLLGFAVLLLVFMLLWRGPRPGDLYSVEGTDKDFKIAKVLAVDSDTVHIRLYKNIFRERPWNLDPSTLSVGSIYDPEGFGAEHLPLSSSSFSLWHPHYITHTRLTEEELEGYKLWKQAQGGRF